MWKIPIRSMSIKSNRHVEIAFDSAELVHKMYLFYLNGLL